MQVKFIPSFTNIRQNLVFLFIKCQFKCDWWAALALTKWNKVGNVTFPHEAIRGINFSSAQVDAFPHHEWPKATSDREMHPRVLRKC